MRMIAINSTFSWINIMCLMPEQFGLFTEANGDTQIHFPCCSIDHLTLQTRFCTGKGFFCFCFSLSFPSTFLSTYGLHHSFTATEVKVVLGLLGCSAATDPGDFTSRSCPLFPRSDVTWLEPMTWICSLSWSQSQQQRCARSIPASMTSLLVLCMMRKEPSSSMCGPQLLSHKDRPTAE